MQVADIIIQLAVRLFSYKGVRFVTAFTCWSTADNIKLMKMFNEQHMAVNLISQHVAISQITEFIEDTNYTKIGVFFQFGCDNSVANMQQCQEEKCFTQKRHWLVYDVDAANVTSDALTTLNTSRLFVDAEISYVAMALATVDRVPIYDVYNNGHHIGGKLNVTLDRYFVPNTNGSGAHLLTRSMVNVNTKYDNRMDLSDITLRVGTVFQIRTNRTLTSAEILAHYQTMRTTDVDNLNKVSYQIATHMQEHLKYNISWTHHFEWSLNDTYGGIIGDILNERIDFSYAYFAMYPNRMQWMHPIVETQSLRSAFLFRTFGSQKASLVGNVFFKPFDTTVWIVLAVCILILAIGIHLIVLDEARRRRNGIEFAPSWMLSMLNTLGLFCQQGASVVPRSINGRLLFLLANVASLIVYSYYTTEVLSALISSPVTTDIKTMTQLAESHVEVRSENAVYIRNYLNKSKLPEIRRLMEAKMIPHENQVNHYMTTEAGLNLVRRGGYAFLSDVSAAYMYMQQKFAPNELCDINEVDMRPKVLLGFFAEPKSPYKELLKAKFRKFRDYGIINKYQRIWLPGKPPCMADSIVFAVGLEYAGPLLVFLAVSMMFSLFILTIEIIDHRLFGARRAAATRRGRMLFGYMP